MSTRFDSPSSATAPAPWRRGLALLLGATLLAACATPQMEGHGATRSTWRGRCRARRCWVVGRGLDVTLERICEDRLAADAQAIGVRVVRADLPRDAVLDPAAGDALPRAARAAGADAVLAIWRGALTPPS